MSFLYLVALIGAGLLVLGVLIDAVLSVSRQPAWEDLAPRSFAQRNEPMQTVAATPPNPAATPPRAAAARPAPAEAVLVKAAQPKETRELEAA